MKRPARKPMRRGSKVRRIAKPAASARSKRTGVLTLPACFDIRSVSAIAQALRDCVSGTRPVLIDAAGVTSTDTAGLQLLLAARRAAQARSLAFEWRGVSEALRATSASVGLSEPLGLP